jgi:hypothetical protein
MKRNGLVHNIAQVCVGDGNIQVAARGAKRGAPEVTDEYIDTLKGEMVMFFPGKLKDRCFSEYDEEHDMYYSGGGFTAALSREERDALNDFVDGFWLACKRLKAGLQETDKKLKEDEKKRQGCDGV